MIIETKKGKVRGIINGDSILRFAGIPYAAPPCGALRWKAPQEVKGWEGVRDCTRFAHSAYQGGAEEWTIEVPSPYGEEWAPRKEEIPDEDCLYLNIWTPAGAVEKGEKLPVLCIIHGGGFESGSGGVQVLDGGSLAKEGIVVVTINYRLGIFGFLAHPQLTEESLLHTSGNYGLLDQIQALKWIRENIAAFGGDPEQVTVSGESAGSISVNALYESPFAKGLFARAAAESGAHIGKDTYCPQISLKEAEEKGAAYLQGLFVDSIDALRKMPAQEIFAGSFGFLPFRDGVVWPSSAKEVFSEHAQNDVPLLLGSNADEGSIFSFYFTLDDYRTRFEEQAKKRYGEDARRFLERYPVADEEKAVYFMSRAYGEKLFAYTIYSWAKLQHAYGSACVYYYYFDRVLPATAEYGAYHSSELPYFYRTMDVAQNKWEQRDRKLMQVMSSYMLNFVKTGNPNGEAVPYWEEFGADTETVMELGEQVGMIVHPSAEMFEIYGKHDDKEQDR